MLPVCGALRSPAKEVDGFPDATFNINLYGAKKKKKNIQLEYLQVNVYMCIYTHIHIYEYIYIYLNTVVAKIVFFLLTKT